MGATRAAKDASTRGAYPGATGQTPAFPQQTRTKGSNMMPSAGYATGQSYGTQDPTSMMQNQGYERGSEEKRKTAPYRAARNMAIVMILCMLVPTIYCAVKTFVRHKLISIDGAQKGSCVDLKTQSESAMRWLTATGPFVVTSCYFLGASMWYFARAMRAGDSWIVRKIRALRDWSWSSRKTGFEKAKKESYEAQQMADMKLKDMHQYEQVGPRRR